MWTFANRTADRHAWIDYRETGELHCYRREVTVLSLGPSVTLTTTSRAAALGNTDIDIETSLVIVMIGSRPWTSCCCTVRNQLILAER